jgi:putative DNA primase/helicase
MSDALCCISTGAGSRKHKHYSNGEEYILKFCNPIIMNGINSMLARDDLADRAIAVTLPVIADNKRKTENEVEAALNATAPGILAWLLGGMVTALKNLPTLKLDSKPRMADFPHLACAAAPAFGWTAAEIMEALAWKRAGLGRQAVDRNLVGKAIEDLATRCGAKGWEGTATQLLAVLNQHAGASSTLDKAWPKDATRMGSRLREVSPALRLVGVNVDIPTNPETIEGKSTRIIKISLSVKPEIEFHSTPENTKMPTGNADPEYDIDFPDVENGEKSLLTALN